MRKEKREMSGMEKYYGRTKQNEKKKNWEGERGGLGGERKGKEKQLRAFVCIKYNIFEN